MKGSRIAMRPAHATIIDCTSIIFPVTPPADFSAPIARELYECDWSTASFRARLLAHRSFYGGGQTQEKEHDSK